MITDKSSHFSLVSVLILISYFILMFGNGRLSLTHPDEVFYVQTAKEMVAHNSWLTPIIFDQPQFEKPIVYFLLSALAIKWFGVSAFVARFWPAFFGILGVVITYWISWMMFGKKRLAFLAGVILSSSFIYLVLARAVLTDMVFSFFVVLSLGCFYWAYKNPSRKAKGIILCFLVSAIAVLTKGLLGFTFVFLSTMIFLAGQKNLGFLKNKWTLIGLFIFFAIAVPWHWLMYHWYGQPFIHEYIQNVHIRRILEAEHSKCDTWFFYPFTMLTGIMPWSVFLIPALWLVSEIFKDRKESRTKLSFLLSWIIGVFLLVQPAHSKLTSYIFPVFPAMAILIAFYFDRQLEKSKREASSLRWCLGVNVFIVFMFIIASFIAASYFKEYVPDKSPVFVFLFCALWTSFLMLRFIFLERYLHAIFANLGITISFLLTLLFAKPYIEPWVSCRQVSDIFNKLDHTTTTVLTSKFYARGVRFYTDRKIAVMDMNGEGFFSPHPIPFLKEGYQLLQFLDSQPVTFAIVKKGDLEDIKRITTGGHFRVEPLYGLAGKYIVKIERI